VLQCVLQYVLQYVFQCVANQQTKVSGSAAGVTRLMAQMSLSSLQCVAVWCSVLQRVVVCCGVLQYVAVCCMTHSYMP